MFEIASLNDYGIVSWFGTGCGFMLMLYVKDTVSGHHEMIMELCHGWAHFVVSC